jgi:hypothetical protein
MDTTTNLPTTPAPALAYRLLHYAPNPVRGDWIYTADRIAKRLQSEFTAVTDISFSQNITSGIVLCRTRCAMRTFSFWIAAGTVATNVE